MDEKITNQNVARIPTLEDLIRLCKSLNDKKTKYVVIGGFAVIHEGYPRATADIDLLIPKSEANFESLREAMMIFEDRAIQEVTAEDVQKYPVIRVIDEVTVDLLTIACGKTYEELQSHIRTEKVSGVEIPFLTLEGLLQTKQGIRPRDVDDRAFLEEKLKSSRRDQ